MAQNRSIKLVNAGALIGTAVKAAGDVVVVDTVRAASLVAEGNIQLDTTAVPTTAYQGANTAAKVEALTANTPVSVDLTSLSGYSGGVTNFSKLWVVTVANLGAADVKVGGASSNAFSAMFGDPTDIVVVTPGQVVSLYTSAAAGWTVDATHKVLKIDPGASAGSVAVALNGTAT